MKVYQRLAVDIIRGGFEYLDVIDARWRARGPRVMPILYVDITSLCNLACRHCGFRDYPKVGPELSTSRWFEILQEAKELKCRIVSFGGGEPFLRQDLVEIIGKARSLGLSVHIDSNGTMIDRVMARRLGAVGPLTIIFSLDSPVPEINDSIRGRGVFRAVSKAVEHVREEAPGVKIGINCVINQRNLGALQDMIRLGAGWGVDSVKFTPLHDNLNHQWRDSARLGDLALGPSSAPAVREALAPLPELARSLGVSGSSKAFLSRIPDLLEGRHLPACYAGYVYGNIDPYGRLFPCYDHRGTLDVSRMSLVEAWRSSQMQDMRDNVRHCANHCWNTGNAEPSLRMNTWILLRNPAQLLEDMGLYLKR